jgi:aromatic ring-opening dioxygenase catalytic subunit (LigB family)
MRELPARLAPPEAILVISAHWEEARPTLLGAPAPSMFYDYYGFPDEAYDITYPAPGSPDLAGRIAAQLEAHGIPAGIDHERGFDHGLFIPLKMMYPEATIPALQISLVRGLNPSVHLALGASLRFLKQENVLVVGSGFSFHNMQAFDWQGGGAADPRNDAFQDWLIETCGGSLPPADRGQRLLEWTQAPSARYCHPREEHLLPLHVCAALAETSAEVVFDDLILGKRAVALLW